ncbi:MAG: ferritin [Flavobacteriales bacterium]
MVSKKIEKLLNEQIALEGDSSQIYLSMASWAEAKGFEGVSGFLYAHAEEEKSHMLKLIHFVNERGGKAIVPAISKPKSDFSSLRQIFEMLYKHEVMISGRINNLVKACLQEGDFTTQSFLQWYVNEQIEEEALARGIIDKLDMIGNDKGGLYLFDRDIVNLASPGAGSQAGQ